MENQVIIVDVNNTVIWLKNRIDLISEDIYRVSAAWIVDSEGRILLAQRAWTKKNNPWKRWPAVAWTLEYWETYESNIIKEIKEEIGIDMNLQNLQAKPIEYREWSWWKNKYFGQWFVGTYDWDKDLIVKQDEEVEAIKWFTRQELEHELTLYPAIFLQSISIKLQEFS